MSRTRHVLIAAALLMDGSMPAAIAQSSPTIAAGAASSAAEPLQEVRVTANRLAIEKRVATFVNQIAAVENADEGLARWQAPPVCPLVSGLSRKDGEFVLERLSQVAHAAGVPLADEHCHANLYILVTAQPDELLRGMEKRNRTFTFDYDRSSYPPTPTPASVVNEFIRTPRAVRVWYNSTETDAGGKPLAYCQSQSVLPQCDEAGFASPAACDPGRYYRCGTAIAGGSHLVFSSIWSFSRVFVIVDEKRLPGVKREQLADYVAMAGFAKLKPDAKLSDAPTILTLFNSAPGSAPASMTDWDRTFLKSLYASDASSRLQRSQVAHQMVRELAH